MVLKLLWAEEPILWAFENSIFLVFRKLLIDEIETISWESETKWGKLFKSRFGHRKLLRKWFRGYFQLKNECSERFNPKTAGERGRGKGGEVKLIPPIAFRKMYFLKRRLNPVFFVTFNVILRHIFPENFIKFPQVVQKIWRNSLSKLAIFINFYRFFGFSDITLLQRN